MRNGEVGDTKGSVKITAMLIVALAATYGFMWWLVINGRTKALDNAGFRFTGLAGKHGVHASAERAVHDLELILGLAAIVCLAFLMIRRVWGILGTSAVGSFICLVIAHAAKTEIGRARPSGGLIHAGGFSFPSTASALAVCATFIAFAYGRRLDSQRGRLALAGGGLTIAAAAGVAFVALRVHYTTDVIAGWALGGCVFCACDILGRTVGSLRFSGRKCVN